MNEADVIAALDMPQSARVDRRVPKKLIVENCARTAADKRRINDGVEEVWWVAALKPTTIGIPEFRDVVREYLEIAVLRFELRATAQSSGFAELLHRAVPYPVLLVTTQANALTISFAHKRRSHGEAGATVLDGGVLVAKLTTVSANVGAAFIGEIAISRQPRADLFALYQGWMDTVVALLAAQVTGEFRVSSSHEMASLRRAALAEFEKLDTRIVRLQAAAAKERQVSRQVELNLELKRVQAEHSAARAKL